MVAVCAVIVRLAILFDSTRLAGAAALAAPTVMISFPTLVIASEIDRCAFDIQVDLAFQSPPPGWRPVPVLSLGFPLQIPLCLSFGRGEFFFCALQLLSSPLDPLFGQTDLVFQYKRLVIRCLIGYD